MKMVLLWKSGMGMCVSMPKYFLYFYTYHFLAEAFLAFILLYPITFRYFSHIHYVYYFVIVLLLAGLFFIFIKYQVSTLLYITILPLAFLLFYFADFPFALMVIFPIVFLCRFMSILQYERAVTDQASLVNRQTINHANRYLKIALVDSAIGVVYSKEAMVVWFVLIDYSNGTGNKSNSLFEGSDGCMVCSCFTCCLICWLFLEPCFYDATKGKAVNRFSSISLDTSCLYFWDKFCLGFYGSFSSADAKDLHVPCDGNYLLI